MSRVLQLLSTDAPGGVSVLADMVGKGLTARGHLVETLVWRAGPWRSARHILTGRYDAILAYQAAGLAGSVLGWLAGIPIRATHRTTMPPPMQERWRWLDQWFGQIGLHTAIIVNSAAADPQAYQGRLRVIRPGVEPLPRAVTGGWAGRLAIPPLAPLLVTAGRLIARKNQQLAIAALADLPAAHLVIAGDGPLRAPLLEQARRLGVAGRLHLLGRLDRPGLAGLLAEADVLVVPSVWERFGRVAIEAGMAGLPVIAADLPVLREGLAPAQTVAFQSTDDPAAWAAAVRDLLAAYPASAQRHAASIALRQTYAVDRMIDDYCRLIGAARGTGTDDFRD